MNIEKRSQLKRIEKENERRGKIAGEGARNPAPADEPASREVDWSASSV
jgi:hypothetical protein